MANEKKFDELLSEAPLAAKEDTVTLVGALQRSHEPGKFVLAMGDGRNVTLDASAVKEHQVLGGAVGQRLVRVDVDRKKVPSDVQGVTLEPQAFLPSNPVIDHGGVVESPFSEVTHVGTFWENGGTLAEHVGNWGDPYGLGYGAINPGSVAATPFALATPHQAAAETVARMMHFIPKVRADITSPESDSSHLWADPKQPPDDRVPQFALDAVFGKSPGGDITAPVVDVKSPMSDHTAPFYDVRVPKTPVTDLIRY
jgi:hypothetical protein